MTIADLFNKKYKSTVWCNNCSTHQEVNIPKGVSIAQFVESGTGKCGNCGCNTLVADYNQIEEFKQQQPQRQPLPQVRVLHNPMRRRQPRPPTEIRERAQVPAQRPSNRPVNAPRPSNRPENMPPPVREAVPEPNFIPKGIFKDDIDFWTGTKKRRDDYRGEQQ